MALATQRDGAAADVCFIILAFFHDKTEIGREREREREN